MDDDEVVNITNDEEEQLFDDDILLLNSIEDNDGLLELESGDDFLFDALENPNHIGHGEGKENELQRTIEYLLSL